MEDNIFVERLNVWSLIKMEKILMLFLNNKKRIFFLICLVKILVIFYIEFWLDRYIDLFFIVN